MSHRKAEKPTPGDLSQTMARLSLETKGGTLDVLCCYRRSSRARSLRLTLGWHREILVTVPTQTSLRRAEKFVREQAEWIAGALARAPAIRTLEKHLREEPWLSLDGQRVGLTLQPVRHTSDWFYSEQEARLILSYQSEKDPESQILAHLKRIAAARIPPRVRMLAARHELDVQRITIRDQRSRWGSCSSRRTISLNWRLLLLEPRLHDHIIWHELAHLEEMNHSPRFWRNLESYDPDARHHDRLVSCCSSQLMALGRINSEHPEPLSVNTLR